MDFATLATQFGIPTAAAVLFGWALWRGFERERADWRADRKELKDELKAERGDKDEINAQVRRAVDTLDRMTTELPKQREQQNEIHRLLVEVRDRVSRLEGQR